MNIEAFKKLRKEKQDHSMYYWEDRYRETISEYVCGKHTIICKCGTISCLNLYIRSEHSPILKLYIPYQKYDIDNIFSDQHVIYNAKYYGKDFYGACNFRRIIRDVELGVIKENMFIDTFSKPLYQKLLKKHMPTEYFRLWSEGTNIYNFFKVTGLDKNKQLYKKEIAKVVALELKGEG